MKIVTRPEKVLVIVSRTLSIVAILMVIGWAIGYFGFKARGMIHLLLVIAITAAVIRIVSGRKRL